MGGWETGVDLSVLRYRYLRRCSGAVCTEPFYDPASFYRPALCAPAFIYAELRPVAAGWFPAERRCSQTVQKKGAAVPGCGRGPAKEPRDVLPGTGSLDRR